MTRNNRNAGISGIYCCTRALRADPHIIGDDRTDGNLLEANREWRRQCICQHGNLPAWKIDLHDAAVKDVRPEDTGKGEAKPFAHARNVERERIEPIYVERPELQIVNYNWIYHRRARADVGAAFTRAHGTQPQTFRQRRIDDRGRRTGIQQERVRS